MTEPKTRSTRLVLIPEKCIPTCARLIPRPAAIAVESISAPPFPPSAKMWLEPLASAFWPLLAEAVTRENSRITLTIALSYGGRAEIVAAVRAIARQAASGSLAAEAIDEECFARHLFTADLPDPDLVIRSSGELGARTGRMNLPLAAAMACIE